METKLSYHSVTPFLLNLRICGYYQIDLKSPKLHRVLHIIYMRFSLIWIIFYTALEAIKIYKEKEDIGKMIGSMFLFLSHTDSIYKQSVFWLKSSKIEELFETMKGPLFNQEEPEHKTHLLATIRQGKRLLQFCNGGAVATCAFFVLYPIVHHLQEKPVEFGIWLPYDFSSTLRFYLTCFYVWITISSQALGNSTMDITITFLMNQCKTQLRILRNDLKNLVHRSKREVLISNASLTSVLEKRFKKIIQHHHEILKFAKKVENIFAGAIFYQLIVCAMTICTSVYRIVDMSPASMEFATMVMYVICMLIECFLYCHYGNELTSESEKLIESAYAMNWHETPIKHRKCLIIFLERAKHPIKPVVGALVPLSNDTFVQIVKNSYSLYTILKTTNE